MKRIPVALFSAWSGTGKTTLIEKLIREFKAQGFKVAVIKHDAHDFEIDREGKDSWRFAAAGSDVTIISSTHKTAVIEQRSRSLSEILSGIRDVDLILAEGYNDEFPESQASWFLRIGISRSAAGKGFRLPLDRYSALITDQKTDSDLPQFALDAIPEIADFLIQRFHL